MSRVKTVQPKTEQPTTEQPTTEQPTSARPMRADASRNRERLIEAARAVLATRGSSTTVEEIAKKADVGVGTLYRHFPRRIDVVEAVYREDVDGLVATAAELAATTEPWEGLVEWLEGFVRYAQAKRTFLTELHEAFEKNPDLAIQSREKIAGAAGTMLSRAQAAGVARPDLDEADLMQLVGGMCMARNNATLEQNQRLLGFVLDGIRR
jgi:AcrR family transcriptional regulator